MSGSAWFWLTVVMIVFWVVPIALFFYKPAHPVANEEEWGAIPYDGLKFNKKAEMIIFTTVCVGFSWLVFWLTKSGLLNWK